MSATAAAGRMLVALLLGAGVLAASAGPAAAHPLGNFTTNTYAGVLVSPDRVTVDYVLDLAEVPAVRTKQELGADAQSAVPPDAAARYEQRRCADLADGVTLEVAGSPQSLRVATADLSFPPGQAGLDTLRLECELTADVGDLGEPTTITLEDGNFPDRVGWREITAVGDRVTLTEANVPTESASQRLTAYPQDRLQTPLRQRTARLVVSPGGSPATVEGLREVSETAADAAERAYTALTAMVSARDLTASVAVLSALAAIALGGMHALAPGHGKTVMAAFLVGHDARPRQAFGLGLTVALTHTVGVLGLGLVLSVTEVAAPERAFPWLGMASGLLFASVGVWMLRRAVKGRGHTHAHLPPSHDTPDPTATAPGHGDHAHTPEGHGDHDHRGAAHHHGSSPGPAAESRLRWRNLIAPGLAGGLVPTPSALVVLLGGVAIGRAWFGVTLVVAYGVGMAATLVGIGYVLLRARRRVTGWLETGEQRPRALVRTLHFLPVITSGLVVIGGLAIAARFSIIL